MELGKLAADQRLSVTSEGGVWDVRGQSLGVCDRYLFSSELEFRGL